MSERIGRGSCLAMVIASAVLALTSSPVFAETLLTEDFRNVAGLGAKGWINGTVQDSIPFVQGPRTIPQPPPPPPVGDGLCDLSGLGGCAISTGIPSGKYSFLQTPELSSKDGATALFWVKSAASTTLTAGWLAQNGDWVGNNSLNVTTSWQRLAVSLPASGNDSLAALTFADGSGSNRDVSLSDVEIFNTPSVRNILTASTLLTENFSNVAGLGTEGWTNGTVPDSVPFVQGPRVIVLPPPPPVVDGFCSGSGTSFDTCIISSAVPSGKFSFLKTPEFFNPLCSHCLILDEIISVVQGFSGLAGPKWQSNRGHTSVRDNHLAKSCT